MRINFTFFTVATGLLCTLNSQVEAGVDDCFSFTNKENKIESRNGLHGLYHPSNDPDNDTPETRDPKRYRVAGKIDQALKFYRAMGSFAEIDGFKLPPVSKTLYIGSVIKAEQYQIGIVASCKTDSNTGGFALFVWGRELRFQYGDGTKSYTAKFKGDIYKGGWKFVEIFFDNGKVECKINGNSIGVSKQPGIQIAANSHPLFIGNYPSARGRMRYAFNGCIDELIISEKKSDVNTASARKMVKKLPAWEAICEPVEGNEVHFGGVKTFHTFGEYPVPLNFKFRGDPKELKRPVFNLYLPENIKLLEAFQSNHNCADELVEMVPQAVEINGMKYLRYSTPENYDFSPRLTRRYRAGKIITCALGQAGKKESGTIYWSLVNDGKESVRHPVLVKFIKPLLPAKNGEFMIMNYFLARDMWFHDKELFSKIAQLYKSSGMTGKGRSYKSHKRRCILDDQLLKNGFTLYEISLWYGPMRNKTLGVAQALDSRGGKSTKFICPTALIANKAAISKYEEQVKRSITPGKTKWVALDYEPWGISSKICFCENCLSAFKSRFKLDDSNLTPLSVRSKYKDLWTKFWVENNAQIIRIMADAARKADPDIKVVEYTYMFNYNDQAALMQRWKSIPKDPRMNEKFLDETMLSMYHSNGRKAFDMLDISLHNLKKPVSVIASLSRVNDSTGSYTTREEALSPLQMQQKAVMCAALGVKTFGLWTGTCIDGMYHIALGRACRDIWQREDFYFSGRRVDKKIVVKPVAPVHQDSYAYTAWEQNGEILVTLFNFSSKKMEFLVGANKVLVPGHGYAFELMKSKL